MSDREKMLALFQTRGIGYIHNERERSIYLWVNPPQCELTKVIGETEAFCTFGFDRDGKFVEACIANYNDAIE